LRGNQIENNRGAGILISGNSNPGLGRRTDGGNNIIQNNHTDGRGEKQVYNNTPYNISAYYNSWGYSTADKIDAHIYDDEELGGGEILFDPWLMPSAAPQLITPALTSLGNNYPNPFNPETWIPFRLAEDSAMTLTIYDMKGKSVREIEVGYRPAGVYESREKAIYWDGRNQVGEHISSGIYFYQLTAANGFTATHKMIVMK